MSDIPIVVNVYKDEYDVYIGRDSKFGDTKWGNPYSNPFMRLDMKLHMYEDYIRKSPDLWNDLDSLVGKRIGCHCKSRICHGDILKKLVIEKLKLKEEDIWQKWI